MKFKNIIVSIIVLLFIFGSIVVSSATNINDMKLALSYGFVQFLILTLAMMVVPIIAYFKNGGVIEFDSGKKLCQCNIFIALGMLFIKDIILYDGIYTNVIRHFGTNIIYSLIYYLINKTLFVGEQKSINTKEKNDQKKECQYLVHNFADDNPNLAKKVKNLYEVKKNNNYEKKHMNIKINTTIIFLFIIIIILLIFIDSQSNSIDKYRSEINSLISKNERLESDVLILKVLNDMRKEKSSFLDENIVLVIEGYENYYYTYDCVKKLTEGNEYSYWAYNIEQAKAKGYKNGTCN